MEFKGYKLDRFQEEAIHHIDNEDSIIVSAPTGAGKTVIAEYAVEHTVKRKKGVIYTAPVKALSSQKYRDFCADYGDSVGILTGDVAINTDAPVLIMTTEIFRNTIFDNPHRLDDVKHVIFDEIHFLDDIERGTVWEESIIFAPEHIRFVCLSATVPNLDEIAGWMSSIRSEKIAVIEESTRPVPLHHFFCVDGSVFKDMKQWPSRRSQHRGRGRGNFRRGGRHRHGERPESRLIKHIHEKDQLPCLYFAFNRNRCQELAEAYKGMRLLNPEDRTKVLDLYDNLVEQYGLASGRIVDSMRSLVSHGVAYHHAGLLPSMKEVVERLFTSGLLKLIFTTSTFSLGINMPARSVVLDELNSFDGVGFSDMTVRTYYQMAGRAGRRGMDDEGIVYARVDSRFLSRSRVKRIVYGSPEPVMSRLNTCYATLLNLMHIAGNALYEAYEKSFHNFLADDGERETAREQIDRKLQVLREMGYTDKTTLTEKGLFAAKLYGYELQAAEFLFSGLLDELDSPDLAVLAMASVFEGRKEPSPEDQMMSKSISGKAGKIIARIRNAESAAGMDQLTPELNFGLTRVIDAWVGGTDFEGLGRITDMDEGGLVRNLRRTMQLLREIRNAARDRVDMVQRITAAIQAINRDVVDAERQLRIM